MVGATGTPSDASGAYLGDYKTREEAERGLNETKQAFHQKAEEASRYKAMFEEMATRTPQGPQGANTMAQPAVPDVSEINEKLRPQLADNPVGTILDLANRLYKNNKAQEKQQQMKTMAEFKQFATDPEYAEVAPLVMQKLPFEENPNVAMEFLKAKNTVLQQRLSGQGQVLDQAPPGFVETPSSQSQSNQGNVVELQLDEDVGRFQKAFKMDDDGMKSFLKGVAKSKMASTGRGDVDIESWRKNQGRKIGG